MSHVIAVANQKGGVGKTTSSVSIGAQLSLFGFKILLIDLDPQASASSGLGVAQLPEGKDLYDMFFGRVPLSDVVQKSVVEGLDVVPASRDLIGLETELGKAAGRELILRSQINLLHKSYDAVIIDCPPSSGLLTLNALGAAEWILVPLQAEYYALEGISQLMNTVSFVTQTFNPPLSVLGVFLTMFDGRTNLSLDVEREAKSFFSDKMFETRIPRNVRISEAPSHGLPIGMYDPISAGAKAYRELSAEIMMRLGLRQTVPKAVGA